MQRFSLYRVHKVLTLTEGRKHTLTDGTTEALLYPHRNALRGDNKLSRMAAFQGMYVLHAKHSVWLQKETPLPKKCDYRTDGRTDAGQSYHHVPQCFKLWLKILFCDLNLKQLAKLWLNFKSTVKSVIVWWGQLSRFWTDSFLEILYFML